MRLKKHMDQPQPVLRIVTISIFFSSFFIKKIFNCSVINLKYCVVFTCTAK